MGQGWCGLASALPPPSGGGTSSRVSTRGILPACWAGWRDSLPSPAGSGPDHTRGCPSRKQVLGVGVQVFAWGPACARCPWSLVHPPLHSSLSASECPEFSPEGKVRNRQVNRPDVWASDCHTHGGHSTGGRQGGGQGWLGRGPNNPHWWGYPGLPLTPVDTSKHSPEQPD